MLKKGQIKVKSGKIIFTSNRSLMESSLYVSLFPLPLLVSLLLIDFQ